MKARELVGMYKKNKSIDLKSVLNVKKYIGVAYKQKIAELVLDASLEEVDGILQMNSFDRYLLFTIAVIEMHTDLEFSDENDEEHSSVDDYDALCEIGLLDKIIDTFKEDYNACQIVLDMMTSDRIKNHDNLQKKIYRFLNNFISQLQGGIESLEDENVLNEFLEWLGSINKE